MCGGGLTSLAAAAAAGLSDGAFGRFTEPPSRLELDIHGLVRVGPWISSSVHRPIGSGEFGGFFGQSSALFWVRTWRRRFCWPRAPWRRTSARPRPLA